MPFEPGQSGNPEGRPKGSKNKMTLEMREILSEGLRKHIGRIPEYIDSIQDPKEKIDSISKILPFILPRYNYQELKVEQTKDLAAHVSDLFPTEEELDEIELIELGSTEDHNHI